MRIAVLNGSPKGRYSTTIHSVLYLQKTFKDDQFDIVETASAIRSLEKNFTPVTEAVRKADIVLFSYPVYTFLVPYQLQRAIELLKRQDIDWKGKGVAQISTSKHFYDVTAHKFIEDNVRDLGVPYLRGLSADMEDLLTEKGRRQLVSFWELVRFRYAQERGELQPYTDRNGSDTDMEVAIITDEPENPALQEMIRTFTANFPGRTRIVDISAFPFKGGCISCFNCAASGECIYKDGFPEFLRKEVHSAQGTVYAFSIKDHSMGSRFKLFDDRQFCNGHRMLTIGAPVGYLVGGDLSPESNLRMLLEAKAEVGQNILCGMVDNAPGRDSTHDTAAMAQLMWFTLTHRTTLPQNFFGVGGTKIFRDLIWTMRGLMKADHRFYKKHGIYDDLPQRHIGKMLQIKLVGLLFNTPSLRRKMGGKLNEGMIAPYRKVLEDRD